METKDKKPVRHAYVGFRVSVAERKKLDAIAQERGITISALLRPLAEGLIAS